MEFSGYISAFAGLFIMAIGVMMVVCATHERKQALTNAFQYLAAIVIIGLINVYLKFKKRK